jgi:hypothetical protein
MSHIDEKEDPMTFEIMKEAPGNCKNMATPPLIFAFINLT